MEDFPHYLPLARLHTVPIATHWLVSHRPDEEPPAVRMAAVTNFHQLQNYTDGSSVNLEGKLNVSERKHI